MPKPAHVMTEDADMAAALKESIAAARKRKQIFSTLVPLRKLTLQHRHKNCNWKLV